MNAARMVLDNLVRLFFDTAVTLPALVLIGVVAALVEVVHLPPLAGSALMLIGCVAILAAGVLRPARRK